MPSALVTGATGFLGRQVSKAFNDAGWQTTGTGFSRAAGSIRKVDIQDADAVERLFNEAKPQVVVHCAADRQPDSCTKNPEAAYRLNVTATQHIASAAARHGSFLIYISTDYVFPGRPGEAPYKATDEPNPTNIYGRTKWEGEKVVLNTDTSNDDSSSVKSVVLRVPVLYGPVAESNSESAVNILMDILYKAQEAKDKNPSSPPIKMDDWGIRYPTNIEDVARVCVDIAKYYTGPANKNSTQQLPRILQFTSEDRMTKYEMCKTFAEIMGLPCDGIVADKDGGSGATTQRPYDCHLDTSDLKKLGIDVSTVDFVAWWRRYVGAFRH
ncbi:Methionine adenosyltransferase 2 subunit beta [Exophiala dermatitidis]